MPRADRVPFLPGRHFVAVRAVLNELVELNLLADTGAQLTMISRRAGARLGVDIGRPLRLQPLQGVGRSPPVPVVRLDRLRVGGNVATNLEVCVYNLPPAFEVDGLLGLDFLRRFRVTFAFDSRMLILREPR